MSRDRLLALLNASPLTDEQRQRVFTDFRDAEDYRDFSRRLSQTLNTPETARLGYDVSTLFKEMQPTNPDGSNMTPEQASIALVQAEYPMQPQPETPGMLDRMLRWASVSPLVDTDAMRARAEDVRQRLGAEYVQRAAQGQAPSWLERAGNEVGIALKRNAPAELLDVFTNPAQLLAMATGVGGAAATALNVQKATKAAQSLQQINRAVQTGLDVAQAASGTARAFTGTSPEDRFAGAAQALLGAASVGVSRRPELATTPIQDVPRVLSRPSNAQIAAQSLKNLSAWQRANTAGRQKTQFTADEWAQHVEPALSSYMAEQKIDPAAFTNNDIAEAMRWYVKRVEQDFDAIAKANPNQRVTFKLDRVRDQIRQRFSELPADRNDALKIVNEEFQSLRAPRTLAQATALRQQLTGKLSDLFGKTGSQQYYATQSSAVKAAYDAMVDEVRDALFRTYDEMNVKTDAGASAQEARRSIRTALQVRDRTELSKELGGQRVAPLPKTFGQSVADNVARNAAFLSGFLLSGGGGNPVMGATVGFTARESAKNALARMRGDNMTRDDIAREIASYVQKNVAPASRVTAPEGAPPAPAPEVPTSTVYRMTQGVTQEPSAPLVAQGFGAPVGTAPSPPPAPAAPAPYRMTQVMTPPPGAPLVAQGFGAPVGTMPRMVRPAASMPEPAPQPPAAAMPTTPVAAEAPLAGTMADTQAQALRSLDVLAEEAKALPDPAEAAKVLAEVEAFRAEVEAASPMPVEPAVSETPTAAISAPAPAETSAVAPPQTKRARQSRQTRQAVAQPEPQATAPVTATPAAEPVVPAPVQEAAPNAKAVAPEQAADKVTNEIVRVIDTAGAKTGAEVQRRVIAALQEQLAAAKDRESRYVFERISLSKNFPAGAALAIKPAGDESAPILAAIDGGGTLVMRGAEELPGNKGETTSYKGMWPQRDLKSLSKAQRDRAEQFNEAAQRSALIEQVEAFPAKVTVQIPGDGTFTIDNNPSVIADLIRRVSQAGPATWRLSPEMKAGSIEPTGAPKPKRPMGADAPGKKVPFNVIPPSSGDVNAYSGLIGEFIEVPAFSQYRFVVTKTPSGWGVYEYSTGIAVSRGHRTKQAAMKDAEDGIARAVKTQGLNSERMTKMLNEYDVLNTAFPRMRED